MTIRRIALVIQVTFLSVVLAGCTQVPAGTMLAQGPATTAGNLGTGRTAGTSRPASRPVRGNVTSRFEPGGPAASTRGLAASPQGKDDECRWVKYTNRDGYRVWGRICGPLTDEYKDPEVPPQ